MDKTRPIEMGICMIGAGGDSGTWETTYIEIPVDTPDDALDQVATDVLIAECEAQGSCDNVAHVWVYCTMEDGWEDEDK